MKHIVKRSGKSEAFDERKLYASIYATCLSVGESVGSAELVADQICVGIKEWIEPKSEVSSDDIRTNAGKQLQQLNEHAAFLYVHHRIMW